MLYPTLNTIETGRVMTERFGGYNHNDRISESEFYYTANLTTDMYPLAASRKKRGIISKLTSPSGLAVKDSLVYADGSSLYYNGNRVEGITLSTLPENCPKKFVSMGAYLCIFPDKIYLNTADMTDFGYMEKSYKAADGTKITYCLCGSDGTAYDSVTASDTEPQDPQNGDYWVDTSSKPHILKQYSSSLSMWAECASVYLKIEAAGIGSGFSEGDGVRINGCTCEDEELNEQLKTLNATLTLKGASDNYIVVTGIIDEAVTVTASGGNGISVERKVPKMDFVTECQNRLWGCYYGIEDGKTVNEIFCCKLGDFKNWETYAGISTDSFRASCGTDGVWTGAATYLGYPFFFKENYVHKVYVSATGAHQCVSAAVEGVEKGSAESMTAVGDLLFYKAPSGINAFDGTSAVSVSEALGQERYNSAVGGRQGNKYYIAMKNTDGETSVFAYDVQKGFWIREDDKDIKFFADMGGELYFIDSEGNLGTMGGSAGVLEDGFSWEAESGMIGCDYYGKKYISRLNLRMSLEKNCPAEFFIQYDSDGKWEKRGVVRGMGKGVTFTLPIVPRRCDHLRFKIKGEGEFRLYSITRVLEKGSDM